MHKMKLVIFFIILPISLNALEWSRYYPKSITVSYYGELLTHPGLLVTGEYHLVENGRSVLFTDFRVGGYNHFMNHTAIFIGAELGYRLDIGTLFGFEVNSGVNYFHKWVDGDIYKISGDTVEKIDNWGSSHILPNITLGFSINMGKRNDKPLTFLVATELFGEYLFNSYMLPHLSINIGVRKTL